MAEAAGHVYALMADGSTVEIRPAGPADFEAVRAMHAAMSPDNPYLRFFNLSKHAAEIEARRLCRDPRAGRGRPVRAGRVIVAPGFGDLVEAAAMLASQPVPAGRTGAIVSNVGGAGAGSRRRRAPGSA